MWLFRVNVFVNILSNYNLENPRWKSLPVTARLTELISWAPGFLISARCHWGSFGCVKYKLLLVSNVGYADNCGTKNGIWNSRRFNCSPDDSRFSQMDWPGTGFDFRCSSISRWKSLFLNFPMMRYEIIFFCVSWDFDIGRSWRLTLRYLSMVMLIFLLKRRTYISVAQAE